MNNVYVQAPHAMEDPVLAAHRTPLMFFLTQLRSIAVSVGSAILALCGHNIDRAFLTMGPGGSALFANVFGGHAFVGMNVYYQEDELRKQADVFTGKVLWVCERLINFCVCECFTSCDAFVPSLVGGNFHHGSTAARGLAQKDDERRHCGGPTYTGNSDEDGVH